jgi:hypothetical protein
MSTHQQSLRAAIVAMAAILIPPAQALSASYPQATFKGQTSQAVAGKLAGMCAQRGWAVTEVNSNAVVCKGEMGAMQSALTQLFVGNSYSTKPDMFIRFTIYGDGEATHVQAFQWIETTMAFGQKRTVELNNDRAAASVQAKLDALALELSPAKGPDAATPGR